MKTSQILLLVAYIGLILLFWSPFVTWHFMDHLAASPHDPHPVRGALVAPSLPFIVLFESLYQDTSHVIFTLSLPIYLAILFWPLLVLGCKPTLIRKTVVKVIIGGYAAVFFAVTACCEVLVLFLRNARP